MLIKGVALLFACLWLTYLCIWRTFVTIPRSKNRLFSQIVSLIDGNIGCSSNENEIGRWTVSASEGGDELLPELIIQYRHDSDCCTFTIDQDIACEGRPQLGNLPPTFRGLVIGVLRTGITQVRCDSHSLSFIIRPYELEIDATMAVVSQAVPSMITLGQAIDAWNCKS